MATVIPTLGADLLYNFSMHYGLEKFYQEDGTPVPVVAGLDMSADADAIFINAPLPTQTKRPLPGLGLGYLASQVEREGLNVGVLDGEAEGLNPQEIASVVNELEPKWVGLNPLAPTYRTAAEIAILLDPRIKIMIGGHEAKARPFDIMQDPAFARVQGVIIGEAEYRVEEILTSDLRRGENAWSSLPAVVWRNPDTGQLVHNPAAHKGDRQDWLAPHLGKMPFLNRKFVSSDLQIDNGRIEANMVGARGCPYDCSFCGAAVSANPDITIRARTPRDILEEMDYLHLAHEVTAFRFVDDLFLGHRRFIQQCMEAFTSEDSGYIYEWDATGRINVLDRLSDEMLDIMVANGCREIALGIESGSERLLGYIDKRIDPAMIKRVVDRLTKRGISVKGYFILGFPTETRAEMNETVRLVHELWDLTDNNPGIFRASVFEFRPYPGTPEWNRLMMTGKYTPEQLLAYTAVDLSESGEDDAISPRDEFNFSVGIQFGEATVEEVRKTLAYLTREQHMRKQQRQKPFTTPKLYEAVTQSERWRHLLNERHRLLGGDWGSKEFETNAEMDMVLKLMRNLAHHYHTKADPSHKADFRGTTEEWARNNLRYYTQQDLPI